MTAVDSGGTVAATLQPLAAQARTIYRYGTQINTHDLIKVLAITTMVIDHAGWLFMDDNVWMRVVGRMAAPLFCYLVGYSGSYRFKWQILALGLALFFVRLFVTADPSMLLHIFPINILITFVLIKAIMNRFDPVKMTTPSLIILLSCLILASASMLVVEFGTLGLAIAIGARLINQRHPFGRPWMVITMAATFLISTWWVFFDLVGYRDLSMQMTALGVLLLAVITVASTLVFLRYRLRVFTLNVGWLRNTLIYISRYSLQIYFFHLAAFLIIYRFI